jgi:PAS domain S-box-containing protein
VWLAMNAINEFPGILDPSTILEITTDCVMLIDDDWRFRYLNSKAVEQLSGGRDLVDANLWEAFPELAGTDFDVAYRRAMADGLPTRAEAFYDPLGAWFVANAYPSREGLIVFFRNTTHRKLNEAALGASEERFRVLFETLTQGVLFINRDGVITDANSAAAELMGVSLEAMRGHVYHSPNWKIIDAAGRVLPPDDYLTTVALRTGRVERGRVIAIFNRKLGEQRWLRGDAIPQFNPGDPSPNAVCILFSDITEQRRAEIACSASQEHLARAQRVAAVGSTELDFKTGQWKWSDEAFRLYGFDKSTVSPSLGLLLSVVHKDDREQIKLGVERAARGIAPKPLEYRIVRPDGRHRMIHRVAELIRDSAGQVTGFIGTNHDVTDLRAAEREKAELQTQLLHSQRLEALGTLAGGIAHDLNNTLVPVTLLSGLLLKGDAPEGRVRECLELIQKSAARGRDLIKRILTFARRSEPEQGWVDVTALVGRVLPLLRSTLPSTIAIRERLGAVPSIMADEGQLNQVIMNLVKNAADAIGDRIGVIVIEVAAEGNAVSENANGTVRLSVIDNGCGMGKEARRRAFEPFFTTKAVNEGTGLGLSVVHGIITSHGGSISVDSRPGKGTRLDIRLPVRVPAPSLHDEEGEIQ